MPPLSFEALNFSCNLLNSESWSGRLELAANSADSRDYQIAVISAPKLRENSNLQEILVAESAIMACPTPMILHFGPSWRVELL